MAASQDYLRNLLDLAKASYEQKVAKIEAERSRKVGGSFTTDEGGRVTGYTPGTTGEYDVAYQRNREALQGGLESRGMLRSGQALEAGTRQATDYQQSVIDYLNRAQEEKAAAGADYALEQAKLRTQYGTTPEAAAPTNVPQPQISTVPIGSSVGGFIGSPAAPRTPQPSAPKPQPTPKPQPAPKPPTPPKPATPAKPAVPTPPARIPRPAAGRTATRKA